MTRRCLMPGCRKAAKPKGDYCSDSHRAAAHKLRKRLGGMLPAERRRERDAAAKRAARAGGVIPSDVRVSWERAVDVVAHLLRAEDESLGWSSARDQAAEVLRPALSDRLQELA